MKYLFKLSAVALAAILLPTTADAAGITYDCDTAANHFSELVLPAPSGSFTVSGMVQLNALAEASKYAPLARVQIASAFAPGQSPASYAGIAVLALPADARKTPSGSPAIQMVAFSVTGKDDEIVPLSALARPGGVQAFTLSFDGRNVSADIAAERRNFPISAPSSVVRFVCSTGEFLFTNVTIQPAG